MMRSIVSAFIPAFASSSTKDQKLAGSAQSRSTSASSSTTRSVEDTFWGASTDPRLQQGGKQDIPEYDYPIPFTVKNTFIDDIDAWRPSSLDGFFQERQIRSCVSRIDAPADREPVQSSAAAAASTNQTSVESIPTVSNYCSNTEVAFSLQFPEFFDALENQPYAEQPMWQEPLQAVEFHCAEQFMWQQPVQLVSFAREQTPWQLPQQVQYQALPATLPPPPPAHAPVLSPELQTLVVPPPPQAQVLRISEAIPEHELEVGSPQLPTKGSVGHHLGTCKPCAFFHTKGCSAGPECEFCHLCEAGARKQNRKKKLALIRQERASD